MAEVNNDQSDEFFVISDADAVIEPKTVMIETFHTLIALATMLRRWVHIDAANVTEEYSFLRRSRFNLVA